ncbi:hypothetical protein [Planomonospora venezuelensis]|uniref:Uncharacterized protein n=1 Tax=Planomonospora venezuelensis TaxID=1999 RepID=A0A841D6S1_PLAVE|nr:hypothetical protein [Planomonospora venezuelensis]MBB5965590.1 hypothetical protein [Planomonospora venezuelensis]
MHTGRVAVRAIGYFNIRTRQGAVQGIGHRHARLLQRADGYGYTMIEEGAVVAGRSVFPPRPEGRGLHTGDDQ